MKEAQLPHQQIKEEELAEDASVLPVPSARSTGNASLWIPHGLRTRWNEP